ncbi:MAG: glycosyltransferase [Pirellulales bacterium]
MGQPHFSIQRLNPAALVRRLQPARLRGARSKLRTLSGYMRRGSRLLLEGRFTELYARTRQAFRGPMNWRDLPAPVDRYQVWMEFNRWTERDEARLRRRLEESAGSLPVVSVLMPVYNPPIRLLERAIETVLAQVYDGWELCVADDASPDPAVAETLRRYAAMDARIKVLRREANGGISLATNSAASLATGEFLAFLDHDDELTPDALAEISLHAAGHPESDFIYSDDDKIDETGARFAPQFKPDWSPELLLSYMYFSHLSAVRRNLFFEVGGIRAGFEGSQDYDFALRATERARGVGHIPRVLYHWRVVKGSTAASGNAKPASFDAGIRAVREAIERRGLSAEVKRPDWAERNGCGIYAHEFPDTGPSVTIVIPTRNQATVLRKCLESLRKTTYRNYQVVVVDNMSDERETLDYLAKVEHRVLRVANPASGFSFAHVNNRAAEQIQSDFILFLNNDTEVLEPRWLSRMMGYARMPGVGAVGARLLFPDGRVQHAGIVHGLYRGYAGPAFKLLAEWDAGYLGYAKVARNYSAVTAACMLTPRKLFAEMGGFDERDFAVAYNDVDYCYRLVDRGYRCAYCPGAELVHHEGYSRPSGDHPAEEAAFRRKYAGRVDRYYSPHLSLDTERFSIQPRRLAEPDQGPVRALMCTHNLNLEGAPNSQFELTVGLKDRGILDPVVYSPVDGPLREVYERHGIPVTVEKSPLEGVFTAQAYQEAVEEFAAFIRRSKVDVVYGNTLLSHLAIAAARRAGVASIWNPRESEPWQSYFNFLPEPIRAGAYACFNHPYRVVFVAQATREAWSVFDRRGTFTVIHNGLNVDRLREAGSKWSRAEARRRLGVAENEVCLVLVGTVCHRKGQHDLAQALAHVSPALWPRLRCFIVGDRASDYSRGLAKRVASLPDALRQRVALIPETPDAALYYRAADIKVCTSRVESFPRVILEAMAEGLPIVTTAVFGIAEQVRPGVNGLFYTPGKVRELARHLETLIADDALRTRMGKNSLEVLATLNSYEDMLAAWGEVFQEASLATVEPGGDAVSDGAAHHGNGHVERFKLDGPLPGKIDRLTRFCGWHIPLAGRGQDLTLVLNGEPYARLMHGMRRADLAAAFPSLPGAMESGFLGDLALPDPIGRDEPFDLRVVRRIAGGDPVVLQSMTCQCRQEPAAWPKRDRSYELASLLVCPDCRQDLTLDDRGRRCAHCGRQAHLRAGVIHLFQDRDELPLLRLTELNPTHPYGARARAIVEENRGGLVLDFGAGNTPPECLFPHVVALDVQQFRNTDIVATTDRLPFRDDTFDAVVSQAVFEHVPDPIQAARELCRVLKPGGTIHIDTAFMQPLHGDPSHYFNMTLAALRRVMAPFAEVDAGVASYQHPSLGLLMQFDAVTHLLPPGPWRDRLSQWRDLLGREGAALDADLGARGREILAAGYYFEGVKPR